MLGLIYKFKIKEKINVKLVKETYDAFSTCSVYDNCQKSIDSTEISVFLKNKKTFNKLKAHNNHMRSLQSMRNLNMH